MNSEYSNSFGIVLYCYFYLMHPTVRQYYDALGLKPGATTDEIKSAYRVLAKRFHPDRNKDVDAHQKFLLITEAYQYLTQKHSAQPLTSTPDKDELRRQARQKAAHAARMRYEDFLKSEYYKTASAVSVIVDILIVLSVVLFASWLPVELYRSGVHTGAWIAAGVLAIALTAAGFLAIKYNKLNMALYIRSVAYILRKSYTRIVVVMLLNIYVLLRFGLLTLVPVHILLLSYVSAIGLSFAVIPYLRYKYRTLLPVILPSIVSLLIVLNYTVTTGEFSQQYQFYPFSGTTTVVSFTHGELEPYAGARFFSDYTELLNKRSARYHFEFGCLGLIVVKQRQLLP